MADIRYGGWQVVAEHLTNQQRLEIKAQHAAQNGDHTETVHQLDDGWSVKKLKRKSDYQLEGQLMQNCVGGYGPERGYHDVYSLRDPDDLPFVTFQMRRQNKDEADRGGYWGHGTTNLPESDNQMDTGTDVLNTTSVLGRNNEQPKEDYGKHLVAALSSIAKNEGIPHVKWDNGPSKTPEQLDQFLEDDKKAPPEHVYLKVPSGMRNEEGGVDFALSGVRRAHNNIKVSLEDPGEQYGFHVFKTPFSEKRFDKEDDLTTRLNSPEDATGGYRIKTKPNSSDPNVEGLKKTQVELTHEAVSPKHVYMKMTPSQYDQAVHSCATCGGTGKEGEDYYGPQCNTCEGTGRGDTFSLRSLARYSYSGLSASPNPPAATDEPEYDHLTVKVPYSEENFTFDANTGQYSAKKKTWQATDASEVSVHKQRDLPEKLYMGIPSGERQNKYVYSEEGVQPVFLRNKSMTLSPNRQHFVGAKGNDIIEVDTSKLPADALLDHRQARGQADRRERWDAPTTHMWKMNPRVAIPYEAITKPATTHEVTGPELKEHLRNEHDMVPAGRAPDRLVQHEQSHAEPGIPGSHAALGGAINVYDQSEQNKRKQFVKPEPKALHDPLGDATLTVRYPEEPPVDSVQFETRLNGKTVSAIKTLEAGNISGEGMHIGVPSREGGPSYGNDLKVHVRNNPEHVEEITPTIKQIREGAGSVQIGGENGTNLRFDHDSMPSQRYFRLKHDLPAGHPAVKSIQSNIEEGKSIIPDTAYVHVPRRRRGDEALYSEKGIDLKHVLEEGAVGRRGSEDLRTAWDKPMEGARGALSSGEDPNEFDVWAVDPHKMPNARVELGRNPYNYGSGREDQRMTGLTLAEGAGCETCNSSGFVGAGESQRSCTECDGGNMQRSVVPWSAVKNLHRKPEEPTAPAIRKYFNTASVRAYKNIFVVR